MGLSKQNKRQFDSVRKKWVVAGREEQIRQMLINKMCVDLAYPRSLICVEKELSSLPHIWHLDHRSLPKRRADILVFAKDIHPIYPLYPLLMIECKACLLTQQAVRQVVGYNAVVQAPFLALTNGRQIVTGYNREGCYCFQSGLPCYEHLMQQLNFF